jgi:hypothetical protein
MGRTGAKNMCPPDCASVLTRKVRGLSIACIIRQRDTCRLLLLLHISHLLVLISCLSLNISLIANSTRLRFRQPPPRHEQPTVAGTSLPAPGFRRLNSNSRLLNVFERFSTSSSVSHPLNYSLSEVWSLEKILSNHQTATSRWKLGNGFASKPGHGPSIETVFIPSEARTTGNSAGTRDPWQPFCSLQV